MDDACLDVVAGKSEKIICHQGHYWDNWGNLYMGYMLSGNTISMLRSLNVITALQLCRRMSFLANYRLLC